MTVYETLQEKEQLLGRGARTGLELLRFWLLELGRTEDDVMGVKVLGKAVVRRPGETLDELEERANPRGSFKAFPFPLLEQTDRTLSWDEWSAAVELSQVLKEIHE